MPVPIVFPVVFIIVITWCNRSKDSITPVIYCIKISSQNGNFHPARNHQSAPELHWEYKHATTGGWCFLNTVYDRDALCLFLSQLVFFNDGGRKYAYMMFTFLFSCLTYS